MSKRESLSQRRPKAQKEEKGEPIIGDTVSNGVGRAHETATGLPASPVSTQRVQAATRMAEVRRESGGVLLLFFCFFGIFSSYFVYGILQELITKRTFGENKEKFRYFFFLVFCQCVVNGLVAWIVSRLRGQHVSPAPYLMYGVTALSYVGAMVASNGALAFVNYPTQVLAKSAKPIPVLLLGVLLARRSYPLIKYLCVLLIVAGVAVFLYRDRPSTKVETSGPGGLIGVGELMLLFSLSLDGVTGALQDRIKAAQDTQPLQMMFAVNFFAQFYLLAGMLISGEGVAALGFVSRYPEVIPNILVFSVASSVGQMFIFTTVIRFGPLVCSIITTVRKFFTLLTSVVFFGNALLPRQWVGVVLVFSGLGLDMYQGHSRSNRKQRTTESV